ncbi:HET-domain-containing protein [Neurospora crassa]|uniref:HET domain-containing protein n=1 Tax=Neurospora crassa (strain ATCC 24698 / 74-OR23-1A / CBS 708.71 / DSM 1257 / FGSC 987) TaxID=367110 RepID=Q7SAC6_NEUCR|nr:HET domain-containing protein [Neurospora crassa OR74A]EAA33330.3 HET domain-containing protein [Neurospora crassa OR74A]KHE83189.1 HET-domain-containing protein [Neurospora crassa]|eukprot:XP_962566.3 HET domain-containing protein [Neurospora crassa OR74A]
MQVVFSQRAPKTSRVSTRALVLQSFNFDLNGELTGISSHFKSYPSITMWLINTRTLELEEFVGADIPAYAILSHTWETGEVTFHDAKAKLLGKQTSQGARKVAKACEVAAEHGLAYAWVDTCCIDKSSSAELTEAINSMFQWYRLSQICLVYLSDLKAVELDHAMYTSRWFKRGWTLQELIAPSRLMFYDQDWKKRGTKEDLASLLSKITRIDIGILLDPSRMYTVPVGKRMSWAADRQTTRLEDRAYSLLGIFDINMPLIYGEGPKAFTRLQEEIIRRSNDVSIFCWRTQENTRWRGILASSPDDFRCAADTEDDVALKNGPEYTLTNKGLRIELDLASAGPNLYLMALYCTDYFKDEWECIYLTAIGKDSYARARPQELVCKARKGLSWVRKQSQYLTEEMDSEMSSITLRHALDRSFTFDGLLHTRLGYQLGGTHPERLWHHDHAAFLHVGYKPFVGCHVLKPNPRRFASAVILAFGVTNEGRSWLCFVERHTICPWSPSQRVLNRAECLNTPVKWSREVRSSIVGSIGQYGIFRDQKEDMLAATWATDSTFLTATLAEEVRDGCTTYVIKLRDKIIVSSEDSQEQNTGGPKDGDRKSWLMRAIGL